MMHTNQCREVARLDQTKTCTDECGEMRKSIKAVRRRVMEIYTQNRLMETSLYHLVVGTLENIAE